MKGVGKGQKGQIPDAGAGADALMITTTTPIVILNNGNNNHITINYIDDNNTTTITNNSNDIQINHRFNHIHDIAGGNYSA